MTASSLSRGDKRRLEMAMCLVQEPKLLLLDEPTAFLDLSHRTLVLRVVRELAAAGCAALVVSHDLTLAIRACDRLLLLDEGRIAASGPPGLVSPSSRAATSATTTFTSSPPPRRRASRGSS